MQAFSPKCLTHLSHCGCHITEELYQFNGVNSTLLTNPGQIISWVPPCMLHGLTYTQGGTICRKPTRYAATRNYVEAAAILHKGRLLPSP